MRFAAFFRNLNLGRPRCPSKTQLEQAFIAAGAVTAASFLTNGTVVFSLPPRRRPDGVIHAASIALRAECGLTEPAFVRSLDHLVELVALDPFAQVDGDAVFERCVSFLPPGFQRMPDALSESKRRDVKVIHFTASEALCVSLKVGNTAGSPNAFIERQLGRAVTTRSWNTILRLVGKYAPD